MTIYYIDPVDEETAWHIPICQVRDLTGDFMYLSLNAIYTDKQEYLKRGGDTNKR